MIKHFNYWLTGTGWAEATFASDNQSISFEVSYLSDPLSELFEALFRLLANKSQREKIVFAEEPGEHSLLLTKLDQSSLNVEIFWSEEWEEIAIQSKLSVDKKLVYTDTDTVENFSETVFNGIQDLLGRTSIEHYKKQWHLFEFPVEGFDRLKEAIRKRS